MPIYEYRCDKGHALEVMQRMADDPLAACTECGAPVQRVFHPIAVHFKGSGFYNTDYGKAKNNKAKEAKEGKAESSSDSSSGSNSKPDSGSSSDSKSTDKSDSKGSRAAASSSSSSKD